MSKPAVIKLPKSLAACADMLFTTRIDRLALQKQVDALAAKESLLKGTIIERLPKSNATGIAGKLARVTVVAKVKPTAEDWAVLWAYMKKTDQPELMQRRLSETAIRERWDDGKEVPGVGKFNYIDVSVNKV